MKKMSVEQAKRLFDEWRQGPLRGRFAPARLRKIALRIRAEQGDRVARQALGLSGETIWRWEHTEGRKKVKTPRARHKAVAPAPKGKQPLSLAAQPQFVELLPQAGKMRAESGL